MHPAPAPAQEEEGGQATSSTNTTEEAKPAPVVQTDVRDVETGESPPAPEELAEGQDGTAPIGVETSALTIAVLSVATGNRMTIKIDSAFIERHALKVDDPSAVSILALKECVWKDWKDELGPRPPSANFIKLFHFGQVLEDRRPLKETRISNIHNAIHLVLRPAESGEDDGTQKSAKLAFGQSRNFGESRRASCRCVIL